MTMLRRSFAMGAGLSLTASLVVVPVDAQIGVGTPPKGAAKPSPAGKTDTQFRVWHRKNSKSPWQIDGDYATKEEAFRQANLLHKQGEQVHVAPANDPKPHD